MKRLILILLLLPSLSFAQQLLWTTIKVDSSDLKYVPLEKAPQEVLKYYNTYNRFYDGSGFSKEAYVKTYVNTENSEHSLFGNMGDSESSLDHIKEPTVMALKLNDGSGSYVSIVYIDENNVDVIAFSNALIMPRMEYTGFNNLDKFKELFSNIFKHETVLESSDNQSDKDEEPYLSNQNEGGSRLAEVLLSQDNRRFVIFPKVEDSGDLSGKIAVEVRVDRDGKIVSARAGVRGTTITNNELFEKCERAALSAQLNRLEKAPPVQSGVIVFNFRIEYKSQ